MKNNLFKMTRRRLIFDVFLALCLLAIAAVFADALWMPGSSFRGEQPPLTAEEKSIESDLRQYIDVLANQIGLRDYIKTAATQKTVDYIESYLKGLGYTVAEQEYVVDGYPFKNIESEIKGRTKPAEIVIVCAHYDTVVGTPGADDNGSGVATVLEMAKLFKQSRPERTIRFVLFGTEEPPNFGSQDMGSYHYAARCKERNEDVVALLDMETLGNYVDQPNSQHYPVYFTPFLPSQGNFIAFVGNRKSRKLVETCISTFRDTTKFPSEGVAAPEFVRGVDWADQKWFWTFGYPGVMITDTALYRDAWYHKPDDTAEKINYQAFARVVGGLSKVVKKLSGI